MISCRQMVVALTKPNLTLRRSFGPCSYKPTWKKPSKKQFGNYNIVKPGKVSEELTVPINIEKPPYFETHKPPDPPSLIEIKTNEQIEKMRNSCTLAKTILDTIGKQIQVGVTCDDLDRLAHHMIIEKGAYPSPLRYMCFPKSICTSVNNVACHGIPDDRPLMDGDIVNVDVSVFLNGFHGDCSKTFFVGNVDDQGKALVQATRECLQIAIDSLKPGLAYNKIGEIIENAANERGFSVVPAFAGHGIGNYFHGPPDIFHISNEYPGEMLPGTTFTIEPVLSQGTQEVLVLEDGWTAVTLDTGRTAQEEHTVLITQTGSEILT